MFIFVFLKWSREVMWPWCSSLNLCLDFYFCRLYFKIYKSFVNFLLLSCHDDQKRLLIYNNPKANRKVILGFCWGNQAYKNTPLQQHSIAPWAVTSSGGKRYYIGFDGWKRAICYQAVCPLGAAPGRRAGGGRWWRSYHLHEGHSLRRQKENNKAS